MSTPPKIKQDPTYQLLRERKVKEFNDLKSKGDQCDLTNCDFRGLNLRGLDADGLDFTGSYFKHSDLRGIDFSNARMDYCSIKEAKISGALFPIELTAEEINLSLIHGTIMRYKN